nr:hypothetical protein Iba_chr05bCG5430 [Ipomoea batatas]
MLSKIISKLNKTSQPNHLKSRLNTSASSSFSEQQPSNRHNFRWGRSCKAGSHSSYPNRQTEKKPRMGADHQTACSLAWCRKEIELAVPQALVPDKHKYIVEPEPWLLEVDVCRSLEVTFFSPTKTTPSLDNTPMALPAFPIASIAYSTWYRRPSGEKIVVRLSYLRDIVLQQVN